MKTSIIKDKRVALAAALTLTLSLPLTAQDFGYPQDRAFYKAHWQEVIADLNLEDEDYLFDAQYVLYDFNHDNTAELYLRLNKNNEYLYANQGGKVVRVSQTDRQVHDDFWLARFTPYFMAPYQLLIDKPINKSFNTEQQLYDIDDIPGLWFKMETGVSGVFNIKSVAQALDCFDCNGYRDALYALSTGQYSKEEVKEFVLDTKNGYASVTYKSDYPNMVELCYWNMAGGEKLVAVHYDLTEVWGENNDNVYNFEQLLFLKFNPKKKELEPIVAPIKGFDFSIQGNIALPRKGLNIVLRNETDEHQLKWTGSGFQFE